MDIRIEDRDLAKEMVLGDDFYTPVSREMISESVFNAEVEYVIKNKKNGMFFIIRADVSKCGSDSGEPFEHSSLPLIFNEAETYTAYRKKI
jgi:hypothetical protein